MVFKLPQELVDEFIDYLHDDRVTLKSCTLVSKSWLPRSRMHLWSTLQLLSLLSLPGHVSRGTDLNSLYKFLASSPHISEYITILEACIQYEKLHNLHTIWPLLPNVMDLTLRSIYDHPISIGFTIQSSSLQSLKLLSLRFHTFIDVVRLISSFPNLASLTIGEITLMEESYQLEDLRSLPLINNIKHLNLINWEAVVDFLPFFVNAPFARHLEIFHLHAGLMRQHTVTHCKLDPLLYASRNSLKDFILILEFILSRGKFRGRLSTTKLAKTIFLSDSEMNIPIIDLASVVSLRTVTITGIHIDEPSHLLWLHATVSSVHSTQLALIKLQFDLKSISSLSQNVHELGAIDELLGSYRLKNVDVQLSVKLRFGGNISTGDVNEFRSVLPRSMKHGILKF